MKTELDPYKLWVPKNSEFVRNTETIVERIGEGIRTQHLMIVAKNGGNILDPSVMRKLLKINNAINNVSITDDEGDVVRLNDICFK